MAFISVALRPRGRVGSGRVAWRYGILALLEAVSAVAASSIVSPNAGPYKTARFKLHSPVHDLSDQSIHITAPVDSNGTFALLVYAHGFLGGGELDIHGYDLLFHQIASYGFVVAAHASCSQGCTRPGGPSRWTACGGLPLMRPTGRGWDTYYAETLKTIEFARNHSAAAPFDQVNFSLGVGIVGHSMGGQSTAYAAGEACTKMWDIRAAVIHHAASGVNGMSGLNIGENITVPTAFFTSTGDDCCEQSTYDIYAATSSTTPRLYRDVVGSSHLEPVLVPPIESPFLATFTAGWFDVIIGQSAGRAGPGSDAYEGIYGHGPESVCKYAQMANCTVAPPQPLASDVRVGAEARGRGVGGVGSIAKASRPNLVLLLADDLDHTLGSAEHALPQTRHLIGDHGATATNWYIHTPICCPSRAELLAGRYFHNLRVAKHNDKGGCMQANLTKIYDDGYFPPTFARLGYTVGIFGKHLNRGNPLKAPAGVDRWLVNGGGEYLNPSFSFDGTSVHFNNCTGPCYSTAVIGNASLDWIRAVRRSAEPKPFFAYVAVKAPHIQDGPGWPVAIPAPWHDAKARFGNVKPPRTPNWNASCREHHWLIRQQPPMTDEQAGRSDALYRTRLGSLLALDDLVAELVHTLTTLDVLDTTFVAFTSDHVYQPWRQTPRMTLFCSCARPN